MHPQTLIVWKYPVTPNSMLIQGSPLHIGLDPATKWPAIWCLVNREEPGEKQPAPYIMVMTGEPLPPEAGQYVTTIAGIEGRLVAHFFRRRKPGE